MGGCIVPCISVKVRDNFGELVSFYHCQMCLLNHLTSPSVILAGFNVNDLFAFEPRSKPQLFSLFIFLFVFLGLLVILAFFACFF